MAIGASPGYVKLQSLGLGKNALRTEVGYQGDIAMIDVPNVMKSYDNNYASLYVKST